MSDVTLLVRSLMTEAEATPWVTPEELSYAATFGTDERRREFLSWRAVVRQELGRDVQIAYNELGAPILVGRAEQLSVSHTRDLLVVALSMHRVGVDIERLDRRYQRILSKYLTPEEQQISTDPHFPAAAWCAKEAIYKWAGIRELSFEEVRIVSYTPERITAQIRGEQVVELTIQQLDADYLLAVCCQER